MENMETIASYTYKFLKFWLFFAHSNIVIKFPVNIETIYQSW